VSRFKLLPAKHPFAVGYRPPSEILTLTELAYFLGLWKMWVLLQARSMPIKDYYMVNYEAGTVESMDR
jgi:hypothetical protein